MSLISNRLLLIILFFNLLVGCQTTPKIIDEPAEVKDLSLTIAEQQNQQIKKAIHLLEKGDEPQAILIIDRVLFLNRNLKTAISLKQQLTLTASEIFNTQRFADYTIKSGDSLGAIALEWLGDPLFFVSLAKLNKIKSPALLEAGMSIKIPVIQSSKIIAQETIRSTNNLKLLEGYLSKKDYLAGLKKIESLFIVTEHQKKLNELQHKLLTGYAESSVSIDTQKIMIEESKLLLNASIAPQQRITLENFIKKQQAQLLTQQAGLLFEDNNTLGSTEKLIQAKLLDTNLATQKNVVRLENKLVDKLHEQAIVNYRNQILDDALKLWLLINQLQPDNELAAKYIERTNNLINKLNKY